ncbi:uncharacterized protein METZ01_LOCUS200324, partial [marine metagenome]
SSPVTIASDITSSDIMEGDFVTATLTVVSSDDNYRKMEMKLQATWQSGIAWETQFVDDEGDELEDNMVYLGKEEETTIKFLIFCEGACKAGDTNTVQVYGQTDPRWYDGGGSGNTCGSDDCETDTSPASGSSNITTKVSIVLTARTGGAHTVDCDDFSETGSNEMFQGETYLWGYDLVNTGWNTDTYTFEATVSSSSGGNVDTWTVSPGLTSKELRGQSDSSSTAVKSAEASMSITPASTARPGTYSIGLLVTSTNGGNVVGCEGGEIVVVIPEPDLEVKDTDISFSHTSSWIGTRSDSQRVTIYAKIRNNGGTIDSQGVGVTNVDVVFVVDGSQVGPVQTITSLDYGEEVTLQAYWNPGRAHTSDEVGIPIKVSVDPNADIQEFEEDNNIGSVYFKVVNTKSSAPSFYVGLLSLVGAVGIAVLLSSYYRNSEEEE